MKKPALTLSDIQTAARKLKERERLSLKINAYKFHIVNIPLFERLKAEGKIYEAHKGVWELTKDKDAAELENL